MRIIDDEEYVVVPSDDCEQCGVKCSLFDHCENIAGNVRDYPREHVILFNNEDYLKYLAAKLTK